jgi:DNA repair protein RadC
MEQVCARLKIKDLPVNERPYEKLERFGPEMLSNAELLAIIIRTGNRSETSVSLAQRVLKHDMEGNGLSFLHHTTVEQLRKIKGIGRVKAIQLKAVMELSKRIASFYDTNRIVLNATADVARVFMEEMRHLDREVFKTVMVNTKNQIIKQRNVSVGSLSASIVHPREVFSEALKIGCAAVIFVHNHPSGDPTPSVDDVDTTRRLVNAGDILGIKVLDHVIIGNGVYVSFKEKGLL